MRELAEQQSGQEEIVAHSVLAHLWMEMRPQQWAKNLTLFAPLLFSHNLFNLVAELRAVAAFTLFCLMSSSVYLLNDILDRERDRLHPQKCYRPLASGQLPISVALGALGGLAVTAVMVGIALSPMFVLVLIAYWILNLLYSLWLKHQVILDVFTVASGFVLRVVGGAVAINVEISYWLLLCTSLLALFLGFSKRRHELLLLREEAGAHRKVLSEYNLLFLDMMISVVTAATVLCYALYTVSEDTVRRFHTRGLLLTLPFVLYGVFRYLYLVYHKDLGGDPTQAILHDCPFRLNLALWVITATVILYWR